MWPRNWSLSSAADFVQVTLPTLCLLGALSTGVVHSGDNYMCVTRVGLPHPSASRLSGEGESENPRRSCDTVENSASPESDNGNTRARNSARGGDRVAPYVTLVSSECQERVSIAQRPDASYEQVRGRSGTCLSPNSHASVRRQSRAASW